MTCRSMRCLVLVAALATVMFPGAGHAGCAGPEVTAAVAGGSADITGQNWVDGCQDACSCSAGCSGQSCDCGPPTQPIPKVTVRVLDAAGGVLVDSTIPAADGAFRITLTWKDPGRAAVVEASGGGLTVTQELVVASSGIDTAATPSSR